MEKKLTFNTKVKGRDTVKVKGIEVYNKLRTITISMNELKNNNINFDLNEQVKVTIEKIEDEE